jgi:hypothetical protein
VRDNDKGANLMTMTVTVTPQATNGTEVDCNFSGTGVEDDTIWLDLNQGYDITFNLVNGPGGSYSFDTSTPFCNQSNRCPSANAPIKKPYSLKPNPTANSITVHVDEFKSRAITHYRLNFAGGFSCDPIIVHD